MDAKAPAIRQGDGQAGGVAGVEDRPDGGDPDQALAGSRHDVHLGGGVVVDFLVFVLELQERGVVGDLQHLAVGEPDGYVVFVAHDRVEHLVAVFAVGLAELRPVHAVGGDVEVAVADGDLGQHADGQHQASVGGLQPFPVFVAVLDGPVVVAVDGVFAARNDWNQSVFTVGDGHRFVFDEVDLVADGGRAGADLGHAGDHVLALDDLDQGLDGRQFLVQLLTQDGQVVDAAFQFVQLVVNFVVAPGRQQECHHEEYRPNQFFHIVMDVFFCHQKRKPVLK